MKREVDVLVIGGGSTGTSVLYNLTKKGIKNCVLVEQGGQIAIGQTSRSTGIIRTHYSHPTLAKMALLSLNFFRDFEREMDGLASGFERTGLLICSDERFSSALSENLAIFKRLGINSQAIDSSEALLLEPNLDLTGYTSIIYEPDAGYADPSLTCASFSKAATDRGATILTGTMVTSIERQSDEKYSVSTTRGEIKAQTVVMATGPWSKVLLDKLGINVPIRCIRHPVAILHRPEEYVGLRPIIFDFSKGAYFKPEGRRLLHVGDLDPAASKSEVDPDTYDESVSFDELQRLSEWVSTALPIMRKGGTLQKDYVGIYDVTPDEQPIIDEFSDEGYDRLFCVIGLSGHGFKLCPEFGRIIADLISEGRFSDYDIDIFSNNRFKEDKLLRSKYELGTIG